MFKFIIALLMICNTALADEYGLRLGSAIPGSDNALVEFPSGSASGVIGKMVNGIYDWEPNRNFYLEGGLGYRSWSDVFQYSSMAYEVSPGLRITAGYLVLRISEGISYMPENTFNVATQEGFQNWDLVTHITFGLKDPKTGLGIYFDRSHYSNGNSVDNPALNYSGFMLLFPF